MGCYRMVIVIFFSACLAGCSVRRNIMFRDGSIMEVEVRGSHHIPFSSGRISLRNASTGEVLVLPINVCDGCLTIDCVEEESEDYDTVNEYISMLKQKGWQWY